MQSETLYECSAKALETIMQAKALLPLYVVQYKLLVDHSDRGFNCPYAIAAARYFHQEYDNELNSLKALRHSVDQLIQQLEADHETTNNL